MVRAEVAGSEGSRAADWWQRTFTSGQQRVQIQDAGGRSVAIAYGESGTGEPLLLLHGIGSWSYNWRYNIAPLAQQFRVMGIDAKGYGFSETPSLPEVVGHQVIECVRIIEALCDRPVRVAAESLGALTALAVAQSRPDLIDRLIVINVPIFPQQLPSSGMRLLAQLPLPWVQWVDDRQWIQPFAPLVQAMTRWVRQEVVADSSQITTEDIYWLTYPYLHIPGTLTQFVADLQLAATEIDRLQQGLPNWIQTIQNHLPQMTCPILILWSDRDRWFPLQQGKQLHQAIPHSLFQIIPNCGHVASSGNPDWVNQAILTFLCHE